MATWTEIGDRVFVRRYAFYDQNIGVVLGDGAALVIDTRSTHVQGREILADLRMLTTDPVTTVVVDTHGHFDHAFGNHVFRPATIWGHAGCPRFMARNAEPKKAQIALAEPSLAGELAEVVIDPPDRLFETATTIEVGGRPVELRFLGRGHTDHDIVVLVPGADVVFAGDLVEGGAVPYFNDGYPLDWPATAEALAGLVTGTIVPGHGDHAGSRVRRCAGGRDRRHSGARASNPRRRPRPRRRPGPDAVPRVCARAGPWAARACPGPTQGRAGLSPNLAT